MTTRGRDSALSKNRRLLDSEITTRKTDRRSFLRRATGAGVLAGAGAFLTEACEEVADRCDADHTDTGFSSDYLPNGRVWDRQDPCDNDGAPGRGFKRTRS